MKVHELDLSVFKAFKWKIFRWENAIKNSNSIFKLVQVLIISLGNYVIYLIVLVKDFITNYLS